jgi:hypothetical protein
VTNFIGCTNVITKTWTAEDGCGNTNTASQTITVIDITAPAITTPAGTSHTTNCPSEPFFTAPTFTDLCKGPITPTSVLTTNVIGCTNVITKTWTAEDGCGNTNTASQTITVIDITAPAITTPAGTSHTTNCPSEPFFTAPTFTDLVQRPDHADLGAHDQCDRLHQRDHQDLDGGRWLRQHEHREPDDHGHRHHRACDHDARGHQSHDQLPE